MSLTPFIVDRVVGKIPYSNEAVLSGWFEKKTITIQYNWPGYLQYGRLGQTVDLGIVGKNSVYGRVAVSPYKYRPVISIKIYGSDGQNLTVRTADIVKLFTWNVENLTVLTSSAELIRIWDDSSEVFAEGANDKNRYISSVTYSSGSLNSTISLNGSLTTIIETGADYLLIGNGLENIRDYVLVDEELNVRSDHKPKQLVADVSASAIYRARLNVDKIEQWRDWPTSFKNAIRDKCQRIFWDYL